MANLIKMDLRRLFLSKVFYITMGIVAALNIIGQIIVPIFMNFFMPGQAAAVHTFAEFIAQPFSLSILMVLMVISIVNFTYADIANGYVKNIAGQTRRKSDVVISKFVAIGVHNLIFMAVSALTCFVGSLVPAAMGLAVFQSDSLIPAALLTFLIKWLLSMAMGAILLFFTTGIKNKTIATIFGVIMGTGALGMLYFGIDQAVAGIFKIENFALSNYMPDQLISNVSVANGDLVANGIIVAAVCITLFFALTITLFNKRDIK